MRHTLLISLLLFSTLYSNEPSNHEFVTSGHDFIFIVFLFILVIFIFLLYRNNKFLTNQKKYSDKEKEKFKTLLAYASDGVHLLDTKGNLFDCSKSFYELLGYDYNEIFTFNIKDLDVNTNEEKIKQFLKKLENSSIAYVTQYRKKDQSLIDLEINAKLILIGNETYVYASARDITQRLKLKQELQYERDLLDTLFDNAEAIVATITLEGVMNKVNKYTEDLTGYTEQEISSKPYFWFEKFIPSNVQPDIKGMIDNLVEKGNVVSKKENEWIIKNGERRMFEWSNKVIFENNKPKFLLTMGIDITDRIRSAEKLKDLNETLEFRIKEATKKLNHSLEIITKNVIGSKTDLDGIIIEVTDKFCEISKYSKEELIGKSHNVVRHEDMPDSLYKDLWETIKAKKIWHGRIKNKNKDGESYWVDSIISPLYDENNIHIGYFSHRIDVTQEVLNSEIQEKHNKELELKVNAQIEEIRQKDSKMLEQAKLASIGELLTNIAHQWRQPLSVISVCASSINYGIEFGGFSNEELMEQIKSINESCDYLTNTIETFDKYLHSNHTFDLTSIENEIKSAKYIVNTSLNANLIELLDEIDYAKSHKCFMIENELSQAIINIITNAEDAFESKKIEYKKWIKITSKEDAELFTIMIEDNAGGIPENIIKRVFEPYFTTKFKSRGIGLGLSLSYSIVVENIKGNLYVENTENGAKFIIELPL